MYACAAVQRWCTLCIPFHIHQSEAPTTHITYLYSPIWQYCTLHSHHIGLTTIYVFVCLCLCAECTRSHRCALSVSPALHVTSSFYRSEALWGEWCAPEDTLLLFRVSYICVVRITSDPGDNENIFTCVVFRWAKSSYKTPLNSYRHSRESKEVSTKSAGSSLDWLFTPALQSEECDTPSAITVSPLWKVES